MNGAANHNGESKLHRAIDLRSRRRERSQEEGERPLWRNLSMVGALGWLIVTPALAGVFIGRWLDRIFNSAFMFTGALIFVGIVLGSYLAWQRIRKE